MIVFKVASETAKSKFFLDTELLTLQTYSPKLVSTDVLLLSSLSKVSKFLMLLGYFFSTPCFLKSSIQCGCFKDHYWEFCCGGARFWGKQPLRGEFLTVYSYTSFILTFLPLAVIWAISPRRSNVHCSTVWKRRKGSACLSEWMKTCKRHKNAVIEGA